MTAYNPTPVTGYSEGIIESTEKPTRCVETFSDDRPDNINFYFEIDGKFYNVHPRRDDLGGYPVRWIDGFAPIGWPKEETTETTEPTGPTTFEQFRASRKIEENLIDVTDAVDWDAIGLSYMDGKYYIEKYCEVSKDQRDPDPDAPLMQDIGYVVTVGNESHDFGSNLDAAERFLWMEWARGEENWKHVCFDTEFGSEYALDQSQVLELIDKGFIDTSWHNDVCPSFHLNLWGHTEYNENYYIKFWFDAPNPEDRETGPETPQFAVVVCHELDTVAELYEGDDFYLALAHALGYAAKPFTDDDWGTERQVEAENAFGCFLVDEILPVKDAQKWEEYALKATTEEMVDYGIELVGRRHHYSAPVDLDSKDVKRLKRIKDAAERLLADAQAGGNRQYAFELWVDGGELADCCHKLDELVNYIDDELNK